MCVKEFHHNHGCFSPPLRLTVLAPVQLKLVCFLLLSVEAWRSLTVSLASDLLFGVNFLVLTSRGTFILKHFPHVKPVRCKKPVSQLPPTQMCMGSWDACYRRGGRRQFHCSSFFTIWTWQRRLAWRQQKLLQVHTCPLTTTRRNQIWASVCEHVSVWRQIKLIIPQRNFSCITHQSIFQT